MLGVLEAFHLMSQTLLLATVPSGEYMTTAKPLGQEFCIQLPALQEVL